MIHLLLTVALLSPAPELPSLGLLQTEDGWHELIGFRNNFLWRNAENPHGPAAPLSAPLVGIEGEVLSIARVEGRILALARERSLTLWTFDAATYEFRASEPVEGGGGPAALDSNGSVWFAGQAEVRCRDNRWDTGEPVLSLMPMSGGWMIVRTPRAWRIARCEDHVLYLLPNP